MQAPPQQLFDNATLIYEADAIECAIKKLGCEITQQLQNHSPVVICVMTGGLVFAGKLLTELNFPLEVGYAHATRYENGTVGKSVVWKMLPTVDLTGRNVLLIDDILDEGITLKAIQDKCLELGASGVKTAVLVEKTLDHAKPTKAEFVGLNVPNAYVFGYGMDVYGWWRNLPAIYHLD